MANGQVDVIVSKAAIEEIERATRKLEKLHEKILEVNKASAKGSGGVSNNKSITKEISETNKLIAANNKLQATANKRLSSIKKNTSATNKNTTATRKASSASKALAGSFNLIGIAMIAMKVKEFVKNIFNLAKTFESLRFSLQKTSNSIYEAQASFNFIKKLSKDLGIELVATTTRFIKFAAAARNSGVAMKDTQKIFKTMAKAGAVLGLRTDELGGIFLALEQMLSKGKVTTEELRRQLGERLPGAFGIMAASLDVTLPKLDKMLRAGEILSADVLPGFADAVEIAFGLDTVDKIDTLVASQGRLTTSWQIFVQNITTGESAITKSFKFILENTKIFVNKMNLFFNEEAVVSSGIRQAFLDRTVEDIKNQSIRALDETKKAGDKTEDLEIRMQKAKADAIGKLQKDQDHEEFKAATTALLKRHKEISKLDQIEAEKSFDAQFLLVSEQQKKLNNIEESVKKQKEIKSKTPLGTSGKLFPSSQSGTYNEEALSLAKLEEEAKAAKFELAELNGVLDAYRLLAQETKPVELEPEDEGGIASKNKRFVDFANVDSINDLQNQIKINQELIDQETNPVRINAIEKRNLALKEELDLRKKMLALLTEDDLSIFGKDSPEEIVNDLDIVKEGIKGFAESLGIDGAEALQEYINTYQGLFDIEYVMEFYKTLEKRTKESSQKRGEQLQIDLEYAQKFADAIGDLGNAIFDKKIARIDEEIRKEEEKYAILFAFAQGDANQTKLLAIQREEDLQKLEAKRRKEVKKQGKFNKAQALVDIAINTAVAISRVVAESVFLGLPLVPVLAALGALQVAAVLAQPLPEFAEGGIMGHDGAAVVGDGGKREVIRTPDGKISLTPAKDTLVNIPKGTEIFPSIEDFNNEQPNDLEDRIYSATLLASISLNQKNIEGMMFSQRELDQRLLDEMIKNTKAVRDSKSNLNVKTQSIDIPHQMWKNKFLS
tara:strand:+ start:2928 stop:5783 length:2856 start_codon:yes stop_codon:yes gene_type:complete